MSSEPVYVFLYDARGDPGYNGMCWYIPGNQCPGGDDCAISNGDTFEDDGPVAYPYVFAYVDGFGNFIAGQIYRVAIVVSDDYVPTDGASFSKGSVGSTGNLATLR